MIPRYKITQDKIKEVKKLLLSNGIRQSARLASVSYSTSWSIAKGKYDNDDESEKETSFDGLCPITGFKLNNQLSKGKKSNS